MGETERVGAPVARRDPTVTGLHGVTRVDEYAWMRSVEDPDVVEHLRAERAFYDAASMHLGPLVGTLANEMSGRVPSTERSAAWRLLRFFYYTKTPAGSDYGQLFRSFDQFETQSATDFVANSSQHAGSDTSGRLLLDPATLAEGSSYVELGLSLVSPDERLLAYSFDRCGDEVYTLRFRDLDTGEDLPDTLARTYYGG
ncbi:MAG: oligopeptidase B, partial [Nocardioidaceae bacterium]